jgi:hypothetical protein
MLLDATAPEALRFLREMVGIDDFDYEIDVTFGNISHSFVVDGAGNLLYTNIEVGVSAYLEMCFFNEGCCNIFVEADMTSSQIINHIGNVQIFESDNNSAS